MQDTLSVSLTIMFSLVIFSFLGVSRMKVSNKSDHHLADKATHANATFRNLNLAQSAPQKKRDLRLHPHAIRTGDYYMFDSPEDREEPIMNEEYDFLERHDIRTRQMAKRVNKKML